MELADFIHFTRTGKIRYHWFLLEVGEWAVFDFLVGRTLDNKETRWDGEPGSKMYLHRQALGEKIRAAVGVYASTNKLAHSVSFVKPYEEIRVLLEHR